MIDHAIMNSAGTQDAVVFSQLVPLALQDFLLSKQGCDADTACYCLASKRHLTYKERLTIYWLIMGLNSKQVAEKMGVSSRTIDNRILAITVRYGCISRYELIIKFIRQDPSILDVITC